MTVCFLGLDLGELESQKWANLLMPFTTWCPDHATYGNTNLERCFGFLCQRCHLCLSQCSSDSVNLNGSTFDIKPHSGDTNSGGFCPSNASSFVWGESSALGKGFFSLTRANYQQHLYSLMDCRTVGCFLNLLQFLVKAYRFQSGLIMRWTISVAFWPLLVSLKSKWGWFPCHYKVISLWGFSTSSVITWMS